MTSQPDPKDGPPPNRIPLTEDAEHQLVDWTYDALVWAFDHETLDSEAFQQRAVTVVDDVLGKAEAALRVVPPEGADNAVHLTVAWNAFSRAWPYETTPTLRDALFVAVEAALESAALRASGAGTRQGEPPCASCGHIARNHFPEGCAGAVVEGPQNDVRVCRCNGYTYGEPPQ
jgi:hypothetical protein